MLRLLLLALLASLLPACSGDSGCSSNRDCALGQVCVSGACQSLAPDESCTEDEQCPLGQVCGEDGECTRQTSRTDAGSTPADGGPAADAGPASDAGPARDAGPAPDGGGGCTSDPQCGAQPSNVCVGGECEVGCGEAGGIRCEAGTRCETTTGHCVVDPNACVDDDACTPGPPTQVCVQGSCVNGCTVQPSRCTAGEVCDTNTGHCVALPMSCASDAQCDPPRTVCESTQCVPGCGAVGGFQCTGATPRCDATTGRCLPPVGSCMLDAHCGDPMQYCDNGTCVPRCDAPAGGCPNGQACDPSTGRCAAGNFAMGDACTFDAQCGSGFCLTLNTMSGSMSVCSLACSAGSQCPTNFTCYNLSGMKFCLGEDLFNPPATFDTAAGGLCTQATNTCQSGWCNTQANTCIESCSRNGDCFAFGNNCTVIAQVDGMGVTRFGDICIAGGASAAGDACAANTDCASGVCEQSTGRCRQLCCSDGDCPAAQSCGLIGLGTTAQSLRKICTPRDPMAGTLPLGSACTMPSDCESEVCAAEDPTVMGGPQVCSTLCCSDADCSGLPGGGRCLPARGPDLGGQSTLVGLCTPS